MFFTLLLFIFEYTRSKSIRIDWCINRFLTFLFIEAVPGHLTCQHVFTLSCTDMSGPCRGAIFWGRDKKKEIGKCKAFLFLSRWLHKRNKFIKRLYMNWISIVAHDACTVYGQSLSFLFFFLHFPSGCLSPGWFVTCGGYIQRATFFTGEFRAQAEGKMPSAIRTDVM